jgi:hypothetical protein
MISHQRNRDHIPASRRIGLAKYRRIGTSPILSLFYDAVAAAAGAGKPCTEHGTFDLAA